MAALCTHDLDDLAALQRVKPEARRANWIQCSSERLAAAEALKATHKPQRESHIQFMSTIVDLPIAVTATSRASMESQLDEAVAVAMLRAIRERRQGILVTQHDFNSFTVDLSPSVPFGMTRERQEW
jgi:hypothetical protein